MPTPRSFHRPVELTFGSGIRPRRSPRISKNREDQDDLGARGAQSVQRSLFSATATPKKKVQAEGESSRNEPSSSDEIQRLAFEGELSDDDDEFPSPPVPLTTKENDRPTNSERDKTPNSTTAPSTIPASSFRNGHRKQPHEQRPPRLSNVALAPAGLRDDIPVAVASSREHVAEQPVPQPQDPTEEQVEKQNEFRRLYVHLHRVSVQNQKSICAAFNVLQAGCKQLRADRLFVVLTGIMERANRSALEVLLEKANEKGKDFKKDYDTTMRLWRASDENKVVPPISDLEKSTGVLQHPRPRQCDQLIDDVSDAEDEEIAAISTPATGMSLEEFARLMIIFRDVPQAAEDLRKSGQDLSRADLDTGRTRDAFWTDQIEVIFNDTNFNTNEQLEPPLQDIDPGRPVTEYREGASLKDLFTKFRKEFTEIHAKWNVSGNMEPDTFINFCRLPKTKTLSRAGARCFIAFKVFHFGLPNQNTLLLDFCSKQIAEGSGARLESGLVPDGQSGLTTSRGRKRASDDAIHDDIRTIMHSLSEQDGSEDPVTKRRKAELDSLKLQRAQREADRYVMQQLMEAHEHQIKLNHPLDNRVNNIVDSYYKRLVEDAEKRMHTSSEGSA